jgi:hypothetical protein
MLRRRPVCLGFKHPSGLMTTLLLLSDTWRVCCCEARLVCRLQFLLALVSTVILGFESRGTHDDNLLSQIRDFPNLEDQAPLFMSPRNRVATLYPQAQGFSFQLLLRLARLR